MTDVFAAVTVSTRTSEAGIERVVLEEGYLRGLRVAGLLPLVLSPLDDPGTHRRLLDAAGGLLLTGGEDVDPGRYDEPVDGARRISPARDDMEFELLQAALERRLPVLAICRGMQLLNVALGGILHQDLATDFDATIAHDSWKDVDASIHTVRPADPALLSDVFAAEPTMQNSAHHQGVERLAPGLDPVGYAPDGLIEAVEYRMADGGWTVGVQWHPERKIDRDDGVNRRLFEAFGDAVRGVRRGSGVDADRGTGNGGGHSGPRLVR
jgi:putative glutamine amidotransferase